MGAIGERALAGHQAAINLAATSFMVPLAIGMAAATRVGNAIGRRDVDGARRAGVASILAGAGVMLGSALCFVLFPEFLARLFTDQADVIVTAAGFIPIAAIFQVFDGTQAVAFGVLRGAADTRIPAAINLVGYWVLGLPLGWLLTFRLDAGPRGLWWGLTIGLAVVALLLLLRTVWMFRQLALGRLVSLADGPGSRNQDAR
jgi:MATE family multidrug resistance protein